MFISPAAHTRTGQALRLISACKQIFCVLLACPNQAVAYAKSLDNEGAQILRDRMATAPYYHTRR